VNKKIVKALKKAQLGIQTKILDIGARGGLIEPWKSVPCELIKTTLVEPDPIEAERLIKALSKNQNSEADVLQYALWSSNTELFLNINRSEGTSSILNPNRSFLKSFPESERFDTLRRLPIRAVSVDYLAEQKQLIETDFLKIDIQGAELNVLNGGISFFKKNLIGLEVEVEFSRMYEGQPLFRDIDRFVNEELSLSLWDLRGTYWRYKTPKYIGGGQKGQLIFADALYLMSIPNLLDFCTGLPTSEARHKVISLILCGAVYGYYDYVYEILQEEAIHEIIGKESKQDIAESLMLLNPSRKFSVVNSINYALYKTFQRYNRMLKKSRNNLGSRNYGPFWWC